MINALTLLRVILLLPLAWLLIATHENSWLVFGIFILAGVTDFLDGYLARLLGKTSAFGAMLDQISDKIFIIVALVAMIAAGLLQNIMLIPVFLIITREFAVAGLREYAAQRNAIIHVDKFGKVKTVLQFLAIMLMLIPAHETTEVVWLNHTGAILLWIATALGLISAARYAISAAKSPE